MVESVAVTVSGGGTTAEPFHLTEIRNYLHLTVSASPVHFALASHLHVHHTNHLVSCPL